MQTPVTVAQILPALKDALAMIPRDGRPACDPDWSRIRGIEMLIQRAESSPLPPVAVDPVELGKIRELVASFAAVKQIRAHAAEANQVAKANALGRLDSILERAIPAVRHPEWSADPKAAAPVNRDGGAPLWSGKGMVPAIGQTVTCDDKPGTQCLVTGYSVESGWLMIEGRNVATGKPGNLAGAEIRG